MLSSGGLVFGIINIVGNFGTVFVDNGYWVSAIAARPSSTHKGYLLGGLVWFAVPFSLATALGLGALALDLPLSASEASKGLVPAATAIALMGKGGSVLLLTMLFMAVTSAGSSELIAVSSLC
ncbi:urea-proton symporter DUR3, partial [Tanacetum coccineum]